MIIGIGTDIIEISRVEEMCRKWRERFCKRIFSTKEADYCFSQKNPYQHLAGKFAAKEAVVKALGKAIPLSNIEILNNENGAPEVFLREMADKEANIKGVSRIDVSVSHSKFHAIAFCVIS